MDIRMTRTIASAIGFILLAGPVHAQTAADIRARNLEAFRIVGNAGIERALVFATETVTLAERSLGSDAQETTTSRSNLNELLRGADSVGARSYSEGNYVGAQGIMRAALGAREQVLGRDHADTAGNRVNLAVAYLGQGSAAAASGDQAAKSTALGEALPLLVAALDAQDRISRDGEATLRTLNYLSVTYMGLQNYAGAEPILVRLLDARTRLLGADHASTREAAEDLAFVRGHMTP